MVGVSWYEAAAYAAWLTEVLRRAREGDPDLPDEDRALVVDLLEAGAIEVCLPTETEWERMAGGVTDEDRYPWDPPEGPATRDEVAILARANTLESDIGGTSPVAMYPLGARKPYGLMDLAGNVWEWTDSWYMGRDEIGCCGAGHGTTIEGSPVVRFATGAIRTARTSRTSVSGFVWSPPLSWMLVPEFLVSVTGGAGGLGGRQRMEDECEL